MKERKRQKLARRETQVDYEYGSADDIQEETTKQTSDETTTKLSHLEKVYEEKKKVKIICQSISPTMFSLPSTRCCSLQFSKRELIDGSMFCHYLATIVALNISIIHKLQLIYVECSDDILSNGISAIIFLAALFFHHRPSLCSLPTPAINHLPQCEKHKAFTVPFYIKAMLHNSGCNAMQFSDQWD